MAEVRWGGSRIASIARAFGALTSWKSPGGAWGGGSAGAVALGISCFGRKTDQHRRCVLSMISDLRASRVLDGAGRPGFDRAHRARGEHRACSWANRRDFEPDASPRFDTFGERPSTSCLGARHPVGALSWTETALHPKRALFFASFVLRLSGRSTRWANIRPDPSAVLRSEGSECGSRLVYDVMPAAAHPSCRTLGPIRSTLSLATTTTSEVAGPWPDRSPRAAPGSTQWEQRRADPIALADHGLTPVRNPELAASAAVVPLRGSTSEKCAFGIPAAFTVLRTMSSRSSNWKRICVEITKTRRRPPLQRPLRDGRLPAIQLRVRGVRVGLRSIRCFAAYLVFRTAGLGAKLTSVGFAGDIALIIRRGGKAHISGVPTREFIPLIPPN